MSDGKSDNRKGREGFAKEREEIRSKFGDAGRVLAGASYWQQSSRSW